MIGASSDVGSATQTAGKDLTTDPPATTNSGSHSNLSAIVGGVVGGAAFFVIGAIAFFCWRSRRNPGKRTQHSDVDQDAVLDPQGLMRQRTYPEGERFVDAAAAAPVGFGQEGV